MLPTAAAVRVVVHLALKELAQEPDDLPGHSGVDELGSTDERRDVSGGGDARDGGGVEFEEGTAEEDADKVV